MPTGYGLGSEDDFAVGVLNRKISRPQSVPAALRATYGCHPMPFCLWPPRDARDPLRAAAVY